VLPRNKAQTFQGEEDVQAASEGFVSHTNKSTAAQAKPKSNASARSRMKKLSGHLRDIKGDEDAVAAYKGSAAEASNSTNAPSVVLDEFGEEFVVGTRCPRYRPPWLDRLEAKEKKAEEARLSPQIEPGHSPTPPPEPQGKRKKRAKKKTKEKMLFMNISRGSREHNPSHAEALPLKLGQVPSSGWGAEALVGCG
jgi:hypothetical protein